MSRHPETDLFVDCQMVGVNEDGVFIPVSEIPKFEEAIKKWRKLH